MLWEKRGKSLSGQAGQSWREASKVGGRSLTGLMIGSPGIGNIIAMILFPFAVAGVVFVLSFALAAVSSSKARFGLGLSHNSLKGSGGTEVEATTLSIMGDYFPIPESWLQMRFGLGYSYGSLRQEYISEARTSKVKGLASRIGIGFAPPEGSGPMAFVDLDQVYDPAPDYLKEIGDLRRGRLPAVTRNYVFSLGWRHSF